MINPSKFLITKASPLRKFVTQLDKSGAILPVVLLEGTVTGGRTYQAYQRDGFVEARERVTEESLAAIFWLFGATMFGKLLDKLSQTFLKTPSKMPAVGRDEIRTPFNNFIDNMAKKLNMTDSLKEAKKTFLARFSVGKTFTSLAIACLFIGYVVPKLNQAITKYIFGRMDKNDSNKTKTVDSYKKLTLKDARSIFSAKDVSINAVENFKASKGNGLYFEGNKMPSFKASSDALLRIVQNFEENAVWKLLGTDVGTVTGRTLNARNNDERVEIMFRDISSIYFYCFSMPHIVDFMNGKDVFKGKNTRLNPMSAMETHNHLINSMARKGMNETVKLSEFKEFALGKEINNEIIDKIFGEQQQIKPKKYLFGLIKKEQTPPVRTVTLDAFESKIDELFAENPAERDKIKTLGRKMSQLMQPKKQGVRMITDSQAIDILKGGAVREPEFMAQVLNNMHKETNAFTNFCRKLVGKRPTIPNQRPLADPYRYISQNTIESQRQQILNYVEAIIQDAEKTGEVTAERMLELNKRNMRRSGLFMAVAMGVSALFLSTIIPKIQYYITYLRTGKNSFPGIENIQNQQNK